VAKPRNHLGTIASARRTLAAAAKVGEGKINDASRRNAMQCTDTDTRQCSHRAAMSPSPERPPALSGLPREPLPVSPGLFLRLERCGHLGALSGGEWRGAGYEVGLRGWDGESALVSGR
jgi:hypothetical protein